MSRIYFLSLCFVVNVLLLSQETDPAGSGRLTLKAAVTNYKQGKTVYFALYRSQKDLDERNFYRRARFEGAELPRDTIYLVFNDVEPGEYIIAGYQDINGDGKLNMGLFGPKEPYRIYRPNYGLFAPRFEKCKFLVSKNTGMVYFELK